MDHFGGRYVFLPLRPQQPPLGREERRSLGTCELQGRSFLFLKGNPGNHFQDAEDERNGVFREDGKRILMPKRATCRAGKERAQKSRGSSKDTFPLPRAVGPDLIPRVCAVFGYGVGWRGLGGGSRRWIPARLIPQRLFSRGPPIESPSERVTAKRPTDRVGEEESIRHCHQKPRENRHRTVLLVYSSHIKSGMDPRGNHASKVKKRGSDTGDKYLFTEIRVFAQTTISHPPRRTGFNAWPGDRIFASGNRAGRCRWLAGFLGDLPFPPPLHSGAAPYSLPSPSPALKTSLLRATQISSLNISQKNSGGGSLLMLTRQYRRSNSSPGFLAGNHVHARRRGRLRGRRSRSPPRVHYRSITRRDVRPRAAPISPLPPSSVPHLSSPPRTPPRSIWSAGTSLTSYRLVLLSPPYIVVPASLSRHRQTCDGNTERLARRSDEALEVRVSVARIAPSLLDLGHAGIIPSFAWSDFGETTLNLNQDGRAGIGIQSEGLQMLHLTRSNKLELWGHGGVVVRLLASRLGEPSLVSCVVTPKISHVGTVPDVAAGRGSPVSPRTRIPTMVHARLSPPSFALQTLMLRGLCSCAAKVKKRGSDTGGSNTHTARLPPRRTGFNPRPGHSRIFACGNRAGWCRWSVGFRSDPPPPSSLHSSTLYSHLISPSSALKTSLLRAVQISQLNSSRPNLSTHSSPFSPSFVDVPAFLAWNSRLSFFAVMAPTERLVRLP
ncbi:hypothetical protein PR048_028753 [Dryococelus australis]|uniref:Uncharacterized protein n=1 Tax=Dryococelus australis TaxID=614101 RepID=A0ABQ9GBF4_9NEOP|nr:hypothetical protein PR048_028753 [Dryococelus australis]